ncbi:Transcriptional regulatory protein FixJ [Pseudomonas sp. URMO17WK12:I11]|nr:Transcriptional regulatory protein FixJ [Pseudomonas sp. URMO17WK12:I11]
MGRSIQTLETLFPTKKPMIDYDLLSDAERAAINAAIQAPGLPLQTALIVDDDDATRELLAEILQVNGVACVTADSVAEALCLLEIDSSIGLVITDLHMYPLGGLALIREIRKSEWADLPVVIVSGDAEVRDAIEAMHLNVVDFLLKPIDAYELINLVQFELGFKGTGSHRVTPHLPCYADDSTEVWEHRDKDETA